MVVAMVEETSEMVLGLPIGSEEWQERTAKVLLSSDRVILMLKGLRLALHGKFFA